MNNCGLAKTKKGSSDELQQKSWNLNILRSGYNYIINNKLKFFLTEKLTKYQYNTTTKRYELTFLIDDNDKNKTFFHHFQKYIFEEVYKTLLTESFPCFSTFLKHYNNKDGSSVRSKEIVFDKECSPPLETTFGID